MRSSVRLHVTVLCAVAVPLGIAAAGRQGPPPAALVARGDAFFADARYVEARDAYRAALGAEDRETSTRAATGLVLSLLRVGDFASALREAQTLRDARPDDAARMALYGDALWGQGRFEEAEAAFEAAVANDPAEPRARHGIARALGAQNRLEEAIAEADAALRLNPRALDAQYTLGHLYERLGRYDEAAQAYARYVELIPNADRSELAVAARLRIRFLQSFGNRRPIDMGPEADTRVWTVPIAIKGDKVFVRVRVNNGTHQLLLDTGSEQTVLSHTLARREGVSSTSYIRAAGVGEAGVRGLQVGRIDRLQIGGLTVRHVPVLIKSPPLGSSAPPEPDAFSPLALGLSVRIDYGRRQLTLARQLPPAPHTHRFPLRVHRLPLVGATLDGRFPAAFAVDTAGEVITVSREAADLIGPGNPFRRIPIRVLGTSGWDPDAFVMPGVDLDLHSLKLPRVPVVVLDLRAPSALLGFQLGGTIGHRFLSRYTVGLDLARSVMELQP